jgi:hypothetical protein
MLTENHWVGSITAPALVILASLGVTPVAASASDPDHEWPARKQRALGGDASECFTQAWWALEHGLTSEAVGMLRTAHRTDSKHPPTTRLVAFLDRLTAACPDPEDLDGYHRRLSLTFRETRSSHFILLHQHSDAEAQSRLELAEQVLVSFYLWFEGHGFDLEPPRSRLVSVWFAHREDYIAFLDRQGASALASTRGYYHPTADLVAIFDERDQPDYRKATESIGTSRKTLINERQTRDANRLSTLDRRQRLAKDYCQSINVATLAHETVHHLVARSGLAPRDGAFPLWVHEGLAMQFEASRDGVWAGIGRVNPLRLSNARAVTPPPSLARLISDQDYQPGFHAGRYAAAWSLVCFLQNRHHAEWVAFLDALRLPSDVSDTRPDRYLTEFRSSFGDDLGGLEAEWRRLTREWRVPD